MLLLPSTSTESTASEAGIARLVVLPEANVRPEFAVALVKRFLEMVF